MHEELPWDLVARGEQHRRPVDAVEAQDVLREQVPDTPASSAAMRSSPGRA